MYTSQLFFKDVLWVVAVHTIKTSWKQKTIFDDSFGENPWGKPKKTKNLEKTNKKQYLETLWESSIDKIQKTSRKPKNKKNKTFQRMFGLRLMFGFLVLPGFFFFWVLTLKKLKNSSFLFFLIK